MEAAFDFHKQNKSCMKGTGQFDWLNKRLTLKYKMAMKKLNKSETKLQSI